MSTKKPGWVQAALALPTGLQATTEHCRGGVNGGAVGVTTPAPSGPRVSATRHTDWRFADTTDVAALCAADERDFYEGWGADVDAATRESIRREFLAVMRRNRFRTKRLSFVTLHSLRHNWPTALMEVLVECAGGFVFGLCLALATFVWALSVVPV